MISPTTGPTVEPKEIARVRSCVKHNIPLNQIGEFCGLNKQQVASAILRIKDAHGAKELLRIDAEEKLRRAMETDQ